VTPLLIVGLLGALYVEYQRISTPNPSNLLVLPILLTVVSAGAVLEIYRMLRIKELRPAWVAGTLLVLLQMSALIVASIAGTEPNRLERAYLAVARYGDVLFLIYLLVKLVAARSTFSVQDASASFLAPLYVMLIRFVIDLYRLVRIDPSSIQGLSGPQDELVARMIQMHAQGYVLLLGFIFVASKVPDMLGYVVGKTFGKTPMAPVLSPKKTWEGGIAGFIGGVAAGMTVVFATPLRGALGLHPLLLIVLCFAVTMSAIVGDLVKSAFKRWAGVKDSGLIPEFGGVLDIVDSFLLSVPVAFLYLSIVPALI
jgi:CDP-diglyceride synthetase